MEIASFVVAVISLVISIIINYKSAKLDSETQALELRKLIIDANDSILELKKSNEKLSKARMKANIEKLLNAYKAICYIRRKKIRSEEFRVLYGNEMVQIVSNDTIAEKLNSEDKSYPYIKKALKILDK